MGITYRPKFLGWPKRATFALADRLFGKSLSHHPITISTAQSDHTPITWKHKSGLVDGNYALASPPYARIVDLPAGSSHNVNLMLCMSCTLNVFWSHVLGTRPQEHSFSPRTLLH